jgi:hypothetical protein
LALLSAGADHAASPERSSPPPPRRPPKALPEPPRNDAPAPFRTGVSESGRLGGKSLGHNVHNGGRPGNARWAAGRSRQGKHNCGSRVTGAKRGVHGRQTTIRCRTGARRR